MKYDKFKAKLRKVSENTLILTVPRNVCEFMGLKNDDMVEIQIRKVVPKAVPSEAKEDMSDVKEV